MLRNLMNKILETAFCFILIAMLIFCLWQVFSRYILNNPSVISEEILRFGLIWFSISAIAYVTGKSQHVSFEMFPDSLDIYGKKRVAILIQSLFIIFSIGVMILGGLKAVSIASMQLSPVMKISMGSIYSILPISGVLMAVYSVLNIIDIYRNNNLHNQNNAKGELS